MSNVQEVQESCGCFRVPVPIYRRRNWNFSESEEYEENMKKYEGNMKKIWRGMKEMKNMKKIWTYIMKEYEGNMKKQDLGRGLEFFPSPPDIFSKGHFRNVTSSREEGGWKNTSLGGILENKDMKHVKMKIRVAVHIAVWWSLATEDLAFAVHLLFCGHLYKKTSKLSLHCENSCYKCRVTLDKIEIIDQMFPDDAHTSTTRIFLKEAPSTRCTDVEMTYPQLLPSSWHCLLHT